MTSTECLLGKHGTCEVEACLCECHRCKICKTFRQNRPCCKPVSELLSLLLTKENLKTIQAALGYYGSLHLLGESDGEKLDRMGMVERVRRKLPTPR